MTQDPTLEDKSDEAPEVEIEGEGEIEDQCQGPAISETVRAKILADWKLEE